MTKWRQSRDKKTSRDGAHDPPSGTQLTAAHPAERALQKCGPRLSLSHSMQVTLLKSKIHRAAVTGASLHYEGSLTVSADIAKMVGLLPYEKILVGNLQNGERFETYVIYGAPEKGLIELNGATAHLGAIGDRLTIMSFARLTLEEAKTHHPRVVVLDAQNQVVRCEDAKTKVGRTEREMALAGE
jgi:aspartate 1-decarboxylase